MGYWKEKQIEQDELDAFCQYLFANDDVVHVVNYEDIPAVETERMYRDRFTNKFKAKRTGLDYLWDENTIVFAPDTGEYPMVIKAANAQASFFGQLKYSCHELSTVTNEQRSI